MKTIKDLPEHSRPREKLREKGASALTDEELVAAVIFAHNHPSGELSPSESDLSIHHQLTEAAQILGLRVLDHIIVARKGYVSFQEEGRM